MTEAVLGLGSNLGDRLANLREALLLLAERDVIVKRTSGVWETAPIPEDQPPFLNAVAVVETGLTPAALLETVKAIESALGRRTERRWGPRPIDLDILFFGDERLDTEALTIPHPRIAERGFVLAPLSEVMSGLLPVLEQRAVDLLAAIGEAGLRRTGLSLGA